MTRTDRPVEVDHYLRQLDEALAGVPDETAQEIREGIAEELFALTPAEAHARIERLGDPVFIAAEARRAAGVPDPAPAPAPTAPTHPAVRRPATETRVYVTLASLAVVFGFVVPLLGPVVGFVLVAVSPVWKRWEKVVAITAPIAAGLGVTIYFWMQVTGPDEVNPISPSGLWLVNGFFAFVLAAVPVGIWLIVRGLRRV